MRPEVLLRPTTKRMERSATRPHSAVLHRVTRHARLPRAEVASWRRVMSVPKIRAATHALVNQTSQHRPVYAVRVEVAVAAVAAVAAVRAQAEVVAAKPTLRTHSFGSSRAAMAPARSWIR